MSNVAQPRIPKQPAPRGGSGRQVTLPGAGKQKKDGGVRGGLLLLGLLLVVASGGAFWYILSELDSREEYLVAARTINRWEIAAPSDFTVIEANLGDGAGIPPRFVGVLLDKWATGRIPAGTIVTPGMFQEPPLSSEEESKKVLIQVSLPVGEAPGGSLNAGDKVALFGAESTDFEAQQSSVGLIGVIELEFVEGDQITYVVTPAEAKAIQDLVDRYTAASERRMWKLGLDLSSQELIDLYGVSSIPARSTDGFDDRGNIGEEDGQQLQ